MRNGDGSIDALAVRMRGIRKRFPGVAAADGVDFDLRRGEIHTLLGENGAGKSTLMQILSGLYRPDAGEIEIDGRPVAIRSPRNALALGIGMLHQHSMLIPRHTVAENAALLMPDLSFLYRAREIERRVAETAQRYGFAVDPGAPAWQLSVGEQQRAEIVALLLRRARILILDEPTAVLAPAEIRSLFAMMRGLAAEGRSIVFISHKLDEVMEISDRITVLRKGRRVAVLDRAATSERALARLMVGRGCDAPAPAAARTGGLPVVELRGIEAFGDRGAPALRGVDLDLRCGEILGIAGVSGNGQRELEQVLTGLRKPSAGRYRLLGREMSAASPAAIIARGLACIPGDRSRVGTAAGLGAVENLILKRRRLPPVGAGILLRAGEAEEWARELIERYSISVPDLRLPVRLLSGGNLQKIVLARELASGPRALLAVHPTRGLDIGAAGEVRAALLTMRDCGAAVLLISEDLDEILALGDRVAVMHRGRLSGAMRRGEAHRETIGLLMTGQGPGAERVEAEG